MIDRPIKVKKAERKSYLRMLVMAIRLITKDKRAPKDPSSTDRRPAKETIAARTATLVIFPGILGLKSITIIQSPIKEDM